MKHEQCPICYHELEVRQCAPCHDCGHMEIEIEHFNQGKHNYNVYEIYKGLKLQLCNFCDVDFGSYKSEYLGFETNQRIGFEHMILYKNIENPSLEMDKFCPKCFQRLKFLTFLRDLRELIKEDTLANKK
ncbi:MAG: hypothetical protein R2753_10790 [Chitinophagales bacterium]